MKTALLIIDIQNAMFEEGKEVYEGDALLKNINLLISKARAFQVPIYYIQHQAASGKVLAYQTKGWEIHPHVCPRQEDIVISKKSPDAFFQTTLQEQLNDKGVQHLVITGVQSEVCVDTTCRRAYSLNYSVTLAADGHSTWATKQLNAEQIINHHNQVLKWFAKVKPSQEIFV